MPLDYSKLPQNQPNFRGTEEQRFWPRVNKAGSIPAHKPELGRCWEWTAGKDSNGYGRFLRTSQRHPDYCHRWAYEKLVGSIPKNRELDHVCRNTSCCNPKHLEAVSHRENILRSESTWAKNALKTHCKRGHLLNDKNTRKYKGGRICKVCQALHQKAWRRGEKLK